jgi:HPt (histidine-containing phosphotransfer) domain-containing protein
VAAVNPKVISDLRALQPAGSPSFMIQLIDSFLTEVSVLVSKLGEAVTVRDARLFERSAQALKGTCGNLGAQAMSWMCAELQSVGHSADWARAARLLPSLEEEFTRVKQELEAEREKG